MMSCFEKNPLHRPSFGDLIPQLQHQTEIEMSTRQGKLSSPNHERPRLATMDPTSYQGYAQSQQGSASSSVSHLQTGSGGGGGVGGGYDRPTAEYDQYAGNGGAYQPIPVAASQPQFGGYAGGAQALPPPATSRPAGGLSAGKATASGGTTSVSNPAYQQAHGTNNRGAGPPQTTRAGAGKAKGKGIQRDARKPSVYLGFGAEDEDNKAETRL
jgi:hypothetical protein